MTSNSVRLLQFQGNFDKIRVQKEEWGYYCTVSCWLCYIKGQCNTRSLMRKSCYLSKTCFRRRHWLLIEAAQLRGREMILTESSSSYRMPHQLRKTWIGKMAAPTGRDPPVRETHACVDSRADQDSSKALLLHQGGSWESATIAKVEFLHRLVETNFSKTVRARCTAS